MSKLKTETQITPLPAYHVAAMHRDLIVPTTWFYYKGEYHLYYLYTDTDRDTPIQGWGHIHSKNLIHWTDSPDILLSDGQHRIFSGTIVQDPKNTSLLGSSSKPPLIIIYTAEHQGYQALYLAYSTDGGIKWSAYTKNPILDARKKEFRDPHIFWHEPSSRWVMTVCVPQEYKVQFYTSKNLIRWDQINDFGGHPSFKKKWVQASLVTVPVLHQKHVYKWILIVNTEDQHATTRYFVGNFDGKGFQCDHALDLVLSIDHGKDFFGCIPCGQAPDHRLLVQAWMGNLAYQPVLPFDGWRGMLTLPRELSLAKVLDGSYRIVQQLPEEWHTLLLNKKELTKSTIANETEWDIDLQVAMVFDLKLDSHKGCTLEFDFGSKTKLLVHWDVVKHQICVDRTSKAFGFDPHFNSFDCAVVAMGHTLSLKIYLDRYSIEIFTDEGRIAMTTLIITQHTLQRFRIIGKQFVAGGSVSYLKI